MVDTWVRAAGPAETTVRPSRRGYWIAAVLLIAGLVFLVLAVASGFALPRQIREFPRVPASAVGGVIFTRPGAYVLSTEHLKPRAGTGIAVGPRIRRGMVAQVLFFVSGLGALATAALLSGITLHRHRRRQRALPPSAGLTGPVAWSPVWDAPPQESVPAYVDAPVYADAFPVSSRPARRQVGLTLSVAAIVVVGLISLFAAAFAGGAPSRTGPVRPAARSGVAASHPSHPAATPSPVTTAPLTPDQRWLQGLAALMRQMNDALPPGTITPRSLRLTAAALRRCPSQLAALGPPPRLYRQTRHQASRACADFAQGATWAEAAARGYTTAAPTSSAGRKLDMLLNRLDAAVNRGILGIDDAYYGAPVIAP